MTNSADPVQKPTDLFAKIGQVVLSKRRFNEQLLFASLPALYKILSDSQIKSLYLQFRIKTSEYLEVNDIVVLNHGQLNLTVHCFLSSNYVFSCQNWSKCIISYLQIKRFFQPKSLGPICSKLTMSLVNVSLKL